MFNHHRHVVPTTDNTDANMMRMCDIHKLTDVPAANQAPVATVVMRRGPQLMVVFSGRPAASEIEAMKQAGVKLGLALSPSELAWTEGLDAFSYVFVGEARRGRTPLKQAAADLAHNGWSHDDKDLPEADLAAPRAPNTPVWMGEFAAAGA